MEEEPGMAVVIWLLTAVTLAAGCQVNCVAVPFAVKLVLAVVTHTEELAGDIDTNGRGLTVSERVPAAVQLLAAVTVV